MGGLLAAGLAVLVMAAGGCHGGRQAGNDGQACNDALGRAGPAAYRTANAATTHVEHLRRLQSTFPDEDEEE